MGIETAIIAALATGEQQRKRSEAKKSKQTRETALLEGRRGSAELTEQQRKIGRRSLISSAQNKSVLNPERSGRKRLTAF